MRVRNCIYVDESSAEVTGNSVYCYVLALILVGSFKCHLSYCRSMLSYPPNAIQYEAPGMYCHWPLNKTSLHLRVWKF